MEHAVSYVCMYVCVCVHVFMYVCKHICKKVVLQLYRAADSFWPVYFTVSAWERAYATNLLRLQREHSWAGCL
jgi:hypothetical protein